MSTCREERLLAKSYWRDGPRCGDGKKTAMATTIKQARMHPHAVPLFGVKRSDGKWYCVDDLGRVVWGREYDRLESDETSALAVIASYAPSVRARLSIKKVG